MSTTKPIESSNLYSIICIVSWYSVLIIRCQTNETCINLRARLSLYSNNGFQVDKSFRVLTNLMNTVECRLNFFAVVVVFKESIWMLTEKNP